MSRLPIPRFIEQIKARLNKTQEGLAIVSDGDTHAAIASGQFVYVKNHSSLAEGLYKATTAISTNAALSGNVSLVSGGLNLLNQDISDLKIRTSNYVHTSDVRILHTTCSVNDFNNVTIVEQLLLPYMNYDNGIGTIILNALSDSGARSTFIINNSGGFTSALQISWYIGDNIKLFRYSGGSWTATIFTGTAL